MKPNFALSLSFEGIQLLHRAAGGWRIVGEADPQAADLKEQLTTLRKTATALEPAGLRCKLLIPNDQIKYITIDSAGLSEEARIQSARTALEGATPYAVDDLAFDTCADGAKTHIAAVARETLAEAQGFANEHRFYPVSCVGVPGGEDYLGEPYFGQTTIAHDLLDEGETVEPDGIAVVIIGSITPADLPVADTNQPEAIPAPLETPAATHISAAPTEKPTENSTTTEEDNADLLSAAMASVEPSPQDQVADIPQGDTNAPSLPPTSDDTDQTSAATSLSGFISRRRKEPAPTVPDAPKPAAPKAPRPPINATPAAPSVSQTVDISEPEKPARKGFLSRRKAPAAAPAPSTPAASAALRPQAIPPAPGQTLIPAHASEAQRMTVFGERSGHEIGGKPRFLGMMLVAALLIFLAGVAAWASVFLDDGLSLSRLFGERSARVSASAPTSTSDGQILPVPGTLVPTEETLQTASLNTGLSDEDGAVLDALRTPILPPDLPLTPEELGANYAVTGIWPIAPQVPPSPATLIDIEDMYLTSIDPVNITSDAIALPAVDSFALDIPVTETPLPATPGLRFALDRRGMVTPSPQGTPAPEGFTVFLGQPPLIPPNPSNRPAPVVAVETAVVIAPNPLADFRPKNRPSDLAETTQRGQLGGLTRSELAEYRPNLRPPSVQQQAETATSEVTSADTAAAVAAALEDPVPEQEVDPFGSATKLALRASPRPDTRPRNFARIVKRAERSAPAEAETKVASIAPRTVTPKIPTKTSVARQATVKNALNLRKVNLIGVYGKPSSRRALVRLDNGRYRKVEVGDRIDGGRVSAIGESELRYTKGGRNVVLKMPRS